MCESCINQCVTGYKSTSYARAVFYAYRLFLFRMDKYIHGHGTEEEAYGALDNWQKWKL